MNEEPKEQSILVQLAGLNQQIAKLGKFPTAADHIKNVKELMPEYEKVLSNIPEKDKHHIDYARAIYQYGRLKGMINRDIKGMTADLKAALTIQCELAGDKAVQHKVETLNALSYFSLLFKKADEAEEYLKEAIRSNELNNDNKAISLTRLGLVSAQKGFHQAALRYHQQSLAIFKSFKQGEWRHLLGRVQAAQAESYAALGENDQAKRLFESAIALKKSAYEDAEHSSIKGTVKKHQQFLSALESNGAAASVSGVSSVAPKLGSGK